MRYCRLFWYQAAVFLHVHGLGFMVYGFLVLCCAELWCAVLCFAWLCWAVLSCAQGGSHRASILTQKRLPLQSYYMLGFPCAVLCCALVCCAGLCWAVLSLADAAQPWAICSNVCSGCSIMAQCEMWLWLGLLILAELWCAVLCFAWLCLCWAVPRVVLTEIQF